MEYGHRVPKRFSVWPNGDMTEHSFRVHVASDSLSPSSRSLPPTPEENKLAMRSPSARSPNPLLLLQRSLSGPSSKSPSMCPALLLLSLIFFAILFIVPNTLITNMEFFYNSLTAPLDGRPNPWSPRVAICLAGGLRHFELTGPSIRENLLLAYPNTDVFVVTPHDEDSWKVLLLEGAHVVGVNIAEQKDYVIDSMTRAVIHESASPKGRQGLLKYLGLVEGCKGLIEVYEKSHNFRYEWVIRTRPDAVWSTKPPPLSHLRRRHFHIPAGSDWWGINDRFTLGNREDSLASFAGISTIPRHYELNQTWLTSEEKFQKLLQFSGIAGRIQRSVPFPFCVLTKRSFSFPPLDLGSAPVAPLGSSSARNGAYCWPCKAEKNLSLIGHVPRLLFGPQKEYCNVSGTQWPRQWPELFDSSVNENFARARKNFEESKDRRSCSKRLNSFFEGVEIQEGGFSGDMLCRLAFPGSHQGTFLDWINEL